MYNIEKTLDKSEKFGMGNSEFVKTFSCSMCHEAIAKLNLLGYHFDTAHTLKKFSNNSLENRSNPKNNSIDDRAKSEL